MAHLALRNATPNDAEAITRMVRLMVADMASQGGHPAATGDDAWRAVAAEIGDDLFEKHVRYVLAETESGEAAGVAGATILTLGGAFAPVRSLHVSAVYVLPRYRGTGLGARLIEHLIAWGREAGCAQCSLNVRAGNPARSLYEKLGFTVFEMAMVRPIAR